MRRWAGLTRRAVALGGAVAALVGSLAGGPGFRAGEAAGAGPQPAAAAVGDLWAWGRNESGQLGDRTIVTRLRPVVVPGLTDVLAVAAGLSHSLAVKSDGAVWAWGANARGQLGDGTTTERNSPVQVQGLTGIVGVSAGAAYNLAVSRDGSVWAWGHTQGSWLSRGWRSACSSTMNSPRAARLSISCSLK